jgi:hypothetical protein
VLRSLIHALRQLNRCCIHLPDGVSIGSYAARQVGLYDTMIAAHDATPPSADHIDRLLSDLRLIAILHARFDDPPLRHSHTAPLLPVPPGTNYTGLSAQSASAAPSQSAPNTANPGLAAQSSALACALAAWTPATLTAAIASAVTNALSARAVASAITGALDTCRKRRDGTRLTPLSETFPAPSLSSPPTAPAPCTRPPPPKSPAPRIRPPPPTAPAPYTRPSPPTAPAPCTRPPPPTAPAPRQLPPPQTAPAPCCRYPHPTAPAPCN